ncbi:hypothetical protein ElyMa_002149900 [Elysia marginata]|uniref:Uncharacterized protein n=1 Tax=Elysia marginata TaxID=1093978 RepID=A0AAV4FKP5_9GAST|nr:hypothetical protein ElyMa_002149900 [Elysia marginata]
MSAGPDQQGLDHDRLTLDSVPVVSDQRATPPGDDLEGDSLMSRLHWPAAPGRDKDQPHLGYHDPVGGAVRILHYVKH